MKFFIKLSLCLLTALYVLGGHWAILQALAWGKMLNEYSKDKAIVEAVIETFDGDHPCQMCIRIHDSKENEDKSPLTPTEKLERFVKICALPFETFPLSTSSKDVNTLLEFLSPTRLRVQWITSPSPPPPRV